MKLLKNILISSVALLSAIMVGCGISDDDRYIEMPTPPAPVNPTVFPKHVLLEDFTGQLCVNCPDAHEAIKQLKAQYGERLVPVAIHCGGSTFSIGVDDPTWPGFVGLRIDEGEALYNTAGGGSLPRGRVNRLAMTTFDGWSTAVYNEMQLEAPLNIKLDISLSPDKSKIHIASAYEVNADVRGKLQFWIIENNITALQLKRNNDMDMDYNHNHVFRGSVMDSDMDFFMTSDDEYSLDKDVDVLPAWNADNLAVVAMVYNASGIVQVLQCPVNSSAQNAVEIPQDTPEEQQ